MRKVVVEYVELCGNALEENTTSEERIREELQKELISKDNTISTMYEQLQYKLNNNPDMKVLEETYK